MRTTLDLPVDLFRRVKAKAALKGVSLKDLQNGFVETGLREDAAGKRLQPHRSSLLVIKRAESAQFLI